ncbi:MAG: mandelate racemase/muconate lactonizing enzyme family protein [Chloroflexi bacterium]|nr:mandelate racemase/muconate lactonizing enzyme family protein [Chloroflexota bacterium]
MKIVDVRTTLLNQKNDVVVQDGVHTVAGRDVLLVEVDTDEGVNGLGFLTGLEIAFGSEMRSIDLIIREGLRPLVVGEELFRTEWIWDRLYRGTLRFGRRGAAVRAISGVDLAIWDAIGKVQGRPLWQILGGYREKVPAYVTCGFYSEGKGLDGLVEEAVRHVREGFTGIKIKVGKGSITENVDRVRAVREAVGDDVKLMVDANGAWDTLAAVHMVKKLEPFDLHWVEEPVAPDNLEGYQAVAAASSIPIAAGESDYTRYDFKELIQRKVVGVIQLDAARCGGVTEWMKIAHMAEAFGIPCAPHAVQELHVQLAAAVPNAIFVEYYSQDHPLQRFLDQLFLEPKETKVQEAGYLLPPTRPGWGLQIDPRVVERHRVMG